MDSVRKYVLSFLIISTVIALFVPLNKNFYYTSDAAKYILLGQSIISGEGYSSIWEPEPTPHTKYSPLLPLLIAPFSTLSPLNTIAMKIAVKIFFIFSGVAIFIFLYKRKLKFLGTIFVLIIFLTNKHFYYLSEGPNPVHLYTLMSLLSLYSLEIFLEEKKNWLKKGVLAAIFCVLCFFTKGNGVTIILAGYCVLTGGIFKKKVGGWKKILLFFLLTSVPIIFWISKGTMNENNKNGYGYSYFSELFVNDINNPLEEEKISLFKLPQRMVDNYKFYINFFVFSSNRLVIHLLTLYFLFWGLRVSLKKGALLAPLYYFLYLGIILIWPWQGYRLYLPLIPLSSLYFALGVAKHQFYFKWILKKFKFYDEVSFHNFIKNKHFLLIVVFLLGAVLMIRSYKIVGKVNAMYTDIPPEFQEFLVTCEFIKNNIAIKDTFYSSIAPAHFLYSNRKAFYPPLTNNKQVILKRFQHDKVDYVVFHSWDNGFAKKVLTPFIKANQESFKKIFHLNSSEIYRVNF